MAQWQDWLPALVGVIVAPLLGWVTAKTTGKAQREAAEIEARGPEWQAYVSEVKQWTREQLAERDKEIGELKDRMEILASRVEKWKTLYFKAVHVIRQWQLTYPQGIEIIPLPAEIADDIR